MYTSKALLYFTYLLITALAVANFIQTVKIFKQRLLIKSLQTRSTSATKSAVIVISFLTHKLYLYDLLQYVGASLDDKQKGMLERKVEQDEIKAGFRRGGDDG